MRALLLVEEEQQAVGGNGIFAERELLEAKTSSEKFAAKPLAASENACLDNNTVLLKRKYAARKGGRIPASTTFTAHYCYALVGALLLVFPPILVRQRST